MVLTLVSKWILPWWRNPNWMRIKKGKAVVPSHYHGIIGTLLYLTASGPDLQFAICMCARYQARLIEKHLHAVKRIFQYLKGTVNQGLWYPKDITPHVLGSFTTSINSLYTVMSDSEDFTVTYTAVSNLFRGLSDIGSPGVDIPPVMPEDPYAYLVGTFQAPPSQDYMPGPEYPPSPAFILEPVYPEFMPPEDDILPAKEQPMPAAVLPNTDSPGYVPEYDLEEDPEEDDDEDPKEDPANYPADVGDDGYDKDESFDDDEDVYVDIKGDDKEEEEHPAPANSTVITLPAVEIDRLLAIHTPLPFPLTPLSSPLPQIPSPPLPSILSPLPVSQPLLVSSPLPVSPMRLLGYRAAMIRLRVEAPSTSHYLPLPPPIILPHTRLDAPSSGTPPLLPIPAPTSSPPLLLPSTNRREDRLEVTLPPQKRLGIALGPRYEVRESSYAVAARPTGGFRAAYGFVATMDREIRRDPERDVGYRITET
ncbi:hypothetical protein Tco_0975922 [Tanacetum coccineum]|uniref:Reverse transcriptase Ty1/copia-type domain-containing protein n=1 Tax=Tanacetum coccineum TaxID=301880 RepID=A0ABQ5EFT2_9ASTR